MQQPLTSGERTIRLLGVGLCLLAIVRLALGSFSDWTFQLAFAWLVFWTDAFILAITLLFSTHLALYPDRRQRQFSIAFLLTITAIIAAYLGGARALMTRFLGSERWEVFPVALAFVMSVVLSFPIVLMAADGVLRVAVICVRRGPRGK